MKDCPDADAALSLLAGVQGLKSWLGTGSPWCHGERAKAVLTKLDTILVACDKKEAKRFSQVGHIPSTEHKGCFIRLIIIENRFIITAAVAVVV